jgi:hypothetical protein
MVALENKVPLPSEAVELEIDTFQFYAQDVEGIKVITETEKLLDDFLKQDNINDFEEYIQHSIAQLIIRVSYETLSTLHLNPMKLIQEQAEMARIRTGESYKENEPAYSDVCEWAVEEQMRQAFNLTISEWKIKSSNDSKEKECTGFEGIVELLRQRGPLVVGGKFVVTSKVKEKLQKFNQGDCSWDIYPVADEDFFFPEVEEDHSIVIIGAEVFGNEKNLYYMDPDDALSAKVKKLYGVSYSNFEKRVKNIYGGTEEAPYIIYGDMQYIQTLENFCRGIGSLKTESNSEPKDSEFTMNPQFRS